MKAKISRLFVLVLGLILFSTGCVTKKIMDTSEAPLTPTAPTIEITYPQNAQTLSGTINIETLLSSYPEEITVLFYLDDQLITYLNDQPFQLPWNTKTVSNGEHTLTVKVLKDGAINTHEITVFISNNETQKELFVNITSPAQAQTVKDTISIEASAFLEGSSIVKIEFFAGNQKIGESTEAPHHVIWNTKNVPNKTTIALKAIALASNGQTAQDNDTSVFVDNAEEENFICQNHNDTIANHVTQNRAYKGEGTYLAKYHAQGSNDEIGYYTFTTVTLRETKLNYFEKGECPVIDDGDDDDDDDDIVNGDPRNISPVAEPLKAYNVNINQTSTSGISAGGFLATQFHVAYSNYVMGAGIVAGGVYYCGRGKLFNEAYLYCMDQPQTLADYLATYQEAVTQANKGAIDPLSNLKDDKVYVIHGKLDTTVKQAVGDAIDDWYIKAGTPSANIFYKNDLNAGHSMPLDHPFDDPDTNASNPCDTVSMAPWMSDCGFDGAGAILKHMYGNLNPKNTGKLNGKLIEFNQADYTDYAPATISLNEKAYAYIPKSCQEGQSCKVHVVWHGCEQIYSEIPVNHKVNVTETKLFGLMMVKYSGYNEWADTNNIITLYPQAIKVGGSMDSTKNPRGCFDWWGYTDNWLNRTAKTYHTKEAVQMKPVMKMIKKLAGQ